MVGMKPAPGHQLHRQLTQLQRYRTHLFVGGQTSSLLRSKKTLLTPRMPENLAPRSTNAATLFRALLLQGKTRVVYLGLPRVTGRHAAWLQTPPLTQKNTISTTVGGMKFCTCPPLEKSGSWRFHKRPTAPHSSLFFVRSPVLLFSCSPSAAVVITHLSNKKGALTALPNPPRRQVPAPEDTRNLLFTEQPEPSVSRNFRAPRTFHIPSWSASSASLRRRLQPRNPRTR